VWTERHCVLGDTGMPWQTRVTVAQRPSQVLNRNRASATLGGMLATTAALGEGGTHYCLARQTVLYVAASEEVCDGLWWTPAKWVIWTQNGNFLSSSCPVSILIFSFLSVTLCGRSVIESRWGRDFPPIQTGPGAHPASCKLDAVSFPGVKCGRGVLMTTHPLLVPLSWNSRAITLPTLWATPGL